VDKVRTEWGFRGVLVKFKLEVGLSEAQLLEVAEQARVHSQANLMAANTLEGMQDWAIIGSGPGSYRKVSRVEFAERLLDAVEESKR
jgi:phosphopantothenate-cysteine ligase/phosphopantothenoylcysteine decarboxylase/phosphopantothenate--cysteine ligase